MKKRIVFTALVAIMTVLLIAGTAFAHTVFFQCWNNSDGTLSCEGGYTDGSSAAGATVSVKDANGSLIFSGQLDNSGTLKFSRPSGNFTVTLEGGPGHTVTVNSNDIK